MARVTIYDVAEAAGVSYQTVSRVLNNKPDVAETTRERVLKVIEELRYIPQGAARNLGSGKRNAVGLLMQNLGHPYWSRLAQGVQSYSTDRGLVFMIGNSHGDRDEEKHQLRILLEHDVGGLVVRPCASSTIIAEIMHYDVPVVAVESPYPSDVDVARVDDAGGMQALTALLVEHGHRHIGLINGPINSAQTPRRQAGYRAGLEAAGIPFDATLVVNTNDYTPKDSMQKVHELLNHSEPPRALLAASAALAQGMLQALEQRNLRVPDDIEVAAYNDGYILPKGVSTATSEPVSRVGQEAAKMLIERIEGYTGPPREFVLPYQLTVGTPINRVPDTSSVSRHMGETTD